MKFKDGYFTPEAAVIFPLLIVIIITFIYFEIYVYDRIMMIQDAYAIATDVRMGTFETEVYTTEHPYIALNDLNISVTMEGLTKVVTINGEWELPVWTSFSREMSYSTEIKNTDPLNIMLYTEALRNITGEDDE